MPPSKSTHPLARLRRAKGLTQGAFAYRIGCSTATIKMIEIGRLALSVRMAKRVAECFHLPETTLLLPPTDWSIEDNEWL